MSDVRIAKLFRNGGSQAVRLPAEFRFEGDEVYVRRDETTGDVTLSTKAEKTRREFWEELFASLDAGKVEDEHFDAYMAERPMNTPVRDRDIFRDDAVDVPREESNEFGKIVDDVGADRQNHPMSFRSRLVDDDA